MFRDIIEGIAVGLFLTGFTYLLGSHLGWLESFSYLEASGVLLNYACVWLTVRQKISCWPLGIVAVILLGILFYKLELYASMALHLAYFLPVQVWAWWNWKYGGESKTELKVSFMSPYEWGIAAAVAAVAWYAIYGVNEYFGASNAFLDVGILVLSVIAQYLLGQKKIESWMVWLVVNIIAIYVYGTTGALLLAAQYVLFFANAGVGAAAWLASYRKDTTPVWN